MYTFSEVLKAALITLVPPKICTRELNDTIKVVPNTQRAKGHGNLSIPRSSLIDHPLPNVKPKSNIERTNDTSNLWLERPAREGGKVVPLHSGIVPASNNKGFSVSPKPFFIVKIQFPTPFPTCKSKQRALKGCPIILIFGPV